MCAANSLSYSETFNFLKRKNILNEQLSGFYKEKKYCDFVWKIGEGENSVCLEGHKIVFCAFSEFCSEHFEELDKTPDFCTTENASSLKSIFDFIYSGSIELSLQNVEGILRVADFLKIQVLINSCIAFMEEQICASHVLQWYNASFPNVALSRLQTKLTEFIINHIEEIMLYTSEDELKSKLFDDVSISEEDVFKGVVAWINHDIPNRVHLAVELLSKINFRRLTPKLIFENKDTIIKFEKSDVMKLIFDWLEWFDSTGKYPESTRELHQKNAIASVLNSNDVTDDTSKLKIVEISEINGIRIRTYHPTRNSWTIDHRPLSHPSGNNIKNFSTTVIENKLIFVGGEDASGSKISSVKFLDLHTLQWTEMYSMKNTPSVVKLAYSNGYFFIFGRDSSGFGFPVELYMFSENNWIEVVHPFSSLPMTNYIEIASNNGMLYWIDFNNGYLKVYDISTSDLTTKPIDKELLFDFQFVAVEGFLYVIEGSLDNNVRRYDLSTNMWKEVAKLPKSCCNNIKTTVCQNKIVTCATNDKNEVVVHEFNLETNTWNELSSFKSDGSFKPYNIFISTAQSN